MTLNRYWLWLTFFFFNVHYIDLSQQIGQKKEHQELELLSVGWLLLVHNKALHMWRANHVFIFTASLCSFMSISKASVTRKICFIAICIFSISHWNTYAYHKALTEFLSHSGSDSSNQPLFRCNLSCITIQVLWDLSAAQKSTQKQNSSSSTWPDVTDQPFSPSIFMTMWRNQ